MSKYIDAEKLIAELTKIQFELNAAYRKPQSDNIVRAISLEYDDIISIITSLQQEQPEVELNDHRIADIIQNLFPINQFIESESLLLNKEEAILFARHFYELGLNARKEK